MPCLRHHECALDVPDAQMQRETVLTPHRSGSPWPLRWWLGEAFGWIEYGMRGGSVEHRKACGLNAIKWLKKALRDGYPLPISADRTPLHMQAGKAVASPSDKSKPARGVR